MVTLVEKQMTTTDEILKRLGIEPKGAWVNGDYNLSLYNRFDLERIVAECQAENKLLRDALENIGARGAHQIDYPHSLPDAIVIARNALDSTPSKGHSTLDAAIRQAKIEALEEAADWFDSEKRKPNPSWVELRRMANELKGE